jgi:hypothetical protein
MKHASTWPTTLVVIGVVAAALTVSAATSAGGRALQSALHAFGVTNCSKSAPCQTFSNTGSGPGVAVKASKNFGIEGSTAFISTAGMNSRAGVFGLDVSTSGTFNSGVLGNSKNGFGVQGSSIQGTGVFGVSSNSTAVIAQSLNGIGLLATSQNSTAILDAGAFNGVDAATTNQSVTTHRVFSTDGGHLNQGVAGLSNSGVGVFASSANWIGAHVQGGFSNFQLEVPALSINSNSTGDLIDACNTSGLNPCGITLGQNSPVFELDPSGNIFITGQIFTSGSCSMGCIAHGKHGERRVRLYTSQESMPIAEDFGSGQLVNGTAHVPLDPSFANVIDKAQHYMVFVTPEGDNNGLFVSSQTAEGFTVQEDRSGRSTLAFDYRIVARPFGQTAVRFQMITTER